MAPASTNAAAILDLDFRQCAIEVSCRDLAVMAATLACQGRNPFSGAEPLRREATTPLLALMGSCGMDDAAGQWLHDVGMPAKSGVAGGVLAVVPGRLNLAIWSPRLDRFGNSMRGIAVCEELSRRLDGAAGPSRLATFSPGMCFGEIGFLTGQPRSADVVCSTGGSCWELGRGRFTGLQQRDPEAAMQLMVAILGELGVKLARTSLQLSLLEHH